MNIGIKILILFVILFQLSAICVEPKKHVYPEKDYQKCWCDANNGLLEVVLPDKARIDCMTNKYAMEVDFAPKWAESIGQSLYYGAATGKQPAILLIIENPEKEQRYLDRILKIAPVHNIEVFTITPDDVKNSCKGF